MGLIPKGRRQFTGSSARTGLVTPKTKVVGVGIPRHLAGFVTTSTVNDGLSAYSERIEKQHEMRIRAAPAERLYGTLVHHRLQRPSNLHRAAAQERPASGGVIHPSLRRPSSAARSSVLPISRRLRVTMTIAMRVPCVNKFVDAQPEVPPSVWIPLPPPDLTPTPQRVKIGICGIAGLPAIHANGLPARPDFKELVARSPRKLTEQSDQKEIQHHRRAE